MYGRRNILKLNGIFHLEEIVEDCRIAMGLIVNKYDVKT
jgi:hypothetical protein